MKYNRSPLLHCPAFCRLPYFYALPAATTATASWWRTGTVFAAADQTATAAELMEPVDGIRHLSTAAAAAAAAAAASAPRHCIRLRLRLLLLLMMLMKPQIDTARLLLHPPAPLQPAEPSWGAQVRPQGRADFRALKAVLSSLKRRLSCAQHLAGTSALDDAAHKVAVAETDIPIPLPRCQKKSALERGSWRRWECVHGGGSRARWDREEESRQVSSCQWSCVRK